MNNFEKFKPDFTGKYSPLLYKWLTHKHQLAFGRNYVFQCHNRIDGDGFYSHWRSMEIIIGNADYQENGKIAGISGRCLRDILSGNRGVNTQGYYYGAAFGLRDITEEFFKKYEQYGRCVWDLKHQMHMIGDEDRWNYISIDRRECNWCGHTQEMIEGKWIDYKSSKPSSILHPMGSMGESI